LGKGELEKEPFPKMNMLGIRRLMIKKRRIRPKLFYLKN